MYDGLDRIPIKNMRFKQLRERVQILQDRYDALLRRLGGDSYFDGQEIDWANIVTPLIRAKVNRIEFRASINSETATRIYSVPDKNGRAKMADGEGNITLEVMKHNLIYKRYLFEDGETDMGDEPKGAVEYWYWNANEWKSTFATFSSEFNQTPAGFQLEGTLEITTDTNGRATISDSFIKMYPPGENGEKGYVPKMQIGYDTASENNNPVIIMGQGSGARYPDENGEVTDECDFKETSSLGYPIRYGQAIMYKTANGLILGGASDAGFARYIDIRTQKNNYDETDTPGIYYYFELQRTDENLIRLTDENGDPLKRKLVIKIADFKLDNNGNIADYIADNDEDVVRTLATEEYVNQKIREALETL